LTPLAVGHPVFDGLPLTGGNIPILTPQSYDIFQRVDWAAGVPPLARLWIKTGASGQADERIFDPAPVVWEITLGRGRILAYACGLRCGLGTPDRWTPAPAAVRFIQNAIRHLSAGRVGVLRGA
jgi:hypothetical protein